MPTRRFSFQWCTFAALYSAAVIGEITYLPNGRLFPLTFADPREVKMALNVDGGSQNKIHAAVGNYFSLLGFQSEVYPWRAHLGLEGAGYFTMRQSDRRFPLETTDGLIGLYAEAQEGAWAFQIRYTHLSAHLSDGSVATPIAYSQEYLTSRVAWLPSKSAQIYFGAAYLTNAVPSQNPYSLQGGGSYFSTLRFLGAVPFAATDLKWRASRLNFNFQTGLAFNNGTEPFRSFRFYYAFYDGSDPRGQYYDTQITTHSIGAEMQI